MKKNGNRVCVYEAYIGDTEDPEIYASGAISEYLNTDVGKWVDENCGQDGDMLWYTLQNDEYSYGLVVYLWCNMTDKQMTYWKLIK